MTREAEGLISKLPIDYKDKIATQYTLICLWVAISMNQIDAIIPGAKQFLTPIIVKLVDADILDRELSPDENGILSLKKKRRIIGPDSPNS